MKMSKTISLHHDVCTIKCLNDKLQEKADLEFCCLVRPSCMNFKGKNRSVQNFQVSS